MTLAQRLTTRLTTRFLLVAPLFAKVAPALGGMPYCGRGACN